MPSDWWARGSPGAQPPPALRGQDLTALSEGAIRGSILTPPDTPKPILRRAAIDQLADLISMRKSVNVTGAPGTGTSTVAIEAARLVAHGRERVIYLDISRICRSEEVARKILIALGQTFATVQSPRVSLDQLSRSRAFDHVIFVFDNCTDSRLLFDLNLEWLPYVAVTRAGPRGSSRAPRNFVIPRLNTVEVEQLLSKISVDKKLPRRYVEQLSSWLSEWPGSSGLIRMSIQRGHIDDLAPVVGVTPSQSEGASILARYIWSIMPQDVSRVLSALLTADWLEVSASDTALLSGVPRDSAKSALDYLCILGILLKVPHAYRMQNSLRIVLRETGSTSQQWRQQHSIAAVKVVLSRTRRIQRTINDFEKLNAASADPVDALDQHIVEPSIRRRYSACLGDIAWIEREWASIEGLINNIVDEMRVKETTAFLASLTSCLTPLRRMDSLPRLQELEYRANRAYGGLQEQRRSLHRLSAALEGQERLLDAIGAQSQALTLSREAGESRQIGFDLINLARLKVSMGSSAEAILALEEAVAIFRSCRGIVGEARALFSLGELYEGAGDTDAAMAVYSRAIRLHEGQSHAHDRAVALLKLGAIHESRSRWNSARRAYADAAATIGGGGDRDLIAVSLQHLGRVLAQLGESAEAISALQRALAIYRDTGDRGDQIKTLLSLGRVADSMGNSAMIRQYYSDALKIAMTVGDALYIGSAQAGLGEAFAKEGYWRGALSWLEQALHSFVGAGLRNEEGPILRRLAEIHGQHLDYALAIAALEGALSVYSDMGDTRGSAIVSQQLGTCYQMLGNEQEAVSYFEQGAAYARRVGDDTAETAALQGLRRSFLTLDLPAEAAAVGRRMDHLTRRSEPSSPKSDPSVH